jgi:hypothetical protein
MSGIPPPASIADAAARPPHIPNCDLPGDPSLILTTNMDLGPNKLKIMKGKSFETMLLYAAIKMLHTNETNEE